LRIAAADGHARAEFSEAKSDGTTDAASTARDKGDSSKKRGGLAGR
jgi:hypothetical protein